MNKKFQIYGIFILLVVVILALYLSNGFGINGVNDFESCVDAGNPIMKSYPQQCSHGGVTYMEDIGSNVEIYFRNELYKQGIENAGGMPIEGFNPGLYMVAFPGFVDSDFDGAEAIGGIWKYKNNELRWIADNPGGLVTSADGTLNDKGLNILLENLEKRLGIEVNSQNDVDQIISLINIHKCEDDERLADACIEIYQPVCGWNDPDKIVCIKYPCASTYSNGCKACQNVEVKYWTPGECPL